MFVFDIYSLIEKPLDNFGCLQTIREHEFAPVKNQKGSKDDSPDTARNLISKLHLSWL